MANWRNDDVINRLKITDKKITPQTEQSPYLKDQSAKNCKSKAFSSQKKKEDQRKNERKKSYSINYICEWTKKLGISEKRLIFFQPEITPRSGAANLRFSI